MKKKLSLISALGVMLISVSLFYFISCTKDSQATKQETTILQNRPASCAVPVTWKIEKKFLLGNDCIVVSVKDIYSPDHIYYIGATGPGLPPGFFAYTFIEPTANIPGNYVRWYIVASSLQPGLYSFKIKTVCNYDGSLCNTGSCQFSDFSTVKTFLVN